MSDDFPTKSNNQPDNTGYQIKREQPKHDE
jgi:hypothetical protein